jgi:fibronectin-binding autotransporter adhesin
LGGGALRVNNTSTTTNASAITGSGSLTKAGVGILVLAGNSTYNGDTFLEAGNIQLGLADALSTGSVLRFSANANDRRLQMQGFNQTLGGVDSTAATGGTLIIEAASDNVSFAPATLTLNVAAGTNYTFSGIVRNAAGTAVNSALTLVKSGAGTQVFSGVAGNVTYSGPTTINAGVLEFAGANSVANNSAITLGGGTVRFSGGGTRSSTISGSGNFEKTGANTLTLSGNNSISGSVSVQAGLLELNSTGGAAAGSAASVSVASGAILLISQSEQVNNSATVSLSGGTIQRGSGVSEVFGNLNLTEASFLDFGTGATGNLTFGTYQNNETPSALLTLNNFLPGNSFTFTSTSFTTNSVGSYFTFGTGYAGSSISNTGSTFTITAIPEPSTYLAAAGLLAFFMWPSRRRLLKDAKSILGLRRPRRERSA